MFPEYFIGFVCVLLGLIVAGILWTFAKQYKTNQYFKKVSPRLPVPYELMSVFGGHAKNIQLSPRNIYIIDGLHRKYGKTFGLYYCEKPWVSTIDLELIKAIVVDEPYANLNRTDPKIPVKEYQTDSIPFVEDDQWKRLRRAYAPGLAKHKIIQSENVRSDLESLIGELKESFEHKLEEAGKGNDEGVMVNISDMMNRFSLGMVFKIFYKQDGLVDFKSKEDYYASMIDRVCENIVSPILILAMVFPFIVDIIGWLVVKFREEMILLDHILKFIKQQTKQNLDAKKELSGARKRAEASGLAFDEDNFTLKNGSTFKRNLVDPIIDNFHSKKITESEYINSTFFLFFASQKTTGDVITMLIYLLACDQEVQDKLRDSINRDGEDSEYLGWCIHESLRLFPPVTAGCSRTIEQDYFTKDGILIPKGTFVLTSTYSINRSVEHWGEDANEFRPDRWSKSKDFHPVQFLSFGYGPRDCLGKHFAMYSIRKLISTLLIQYKFSATAKTSRNTQFKAPFFILTSFDDNYWLKLTRIQGDQGS